MSFFSRLFGKKKKTTPAVPEPIPPELDAILRDHIEESKLPCIKLTPKRGSTTVFSSKLGGMPYLPPNFEYPRFRKDGENGKPLRLLAQLNLGELPKLPGFPHKGILQFYIADGYDDVLGLDFDEPAAGNGFRVVYHESVIRDEAQLQAPPVLKTEDFPFEGEFALDAELSSLPMNPNDFRFGEQFMEVYKRYIPTDKQYHQLPSSQSEKVYETLDGWGHHISGYPAFTQEDPRNIGGWREEKTVLLLQIDSVNTDDPIMWGDCGVANFFISPEDLEKCDFSRVLFNWDCY